MFHAYSLHPEQCEVSFQLHICPVLQEKPSRLLAFISANRRDDNINGLQQVDEEGNKGKFSVGRHYFSEENVTIDLVWGRN